MKLSINNNNNKRSCSLIYIIVFCTWYILCYSTIFTVAKSTNSRTLIHSGHGRLGSSISNNRMLHGQKRKIWKKKKTIITTSNEKKKQSRWHALKHGRTDYQPKMRELLNKYGDQKIIRIQLQKGKISNFIKGFIHAFRVGGLADKMKFWKRDKKTNKKISKDGHLYHIGAILTLENKKRLLFEKFESAYLYKVKADLNEQIKKDGDVLKEVKLSTTYNEITLKLLIEKTKMKIGGLKSFNGYSARHNNCQHFMMAMLDGLGLNTKELSEFVQQDLDHNYQQGKKKGILEKTTNLLTDAWRKANILMNGAFIEVKNK